SATAWRSSLVIEPAGPLPERPARSMPRSLASLRTGGLASPAGVPADQPLEGSAAGRLPEEPSPQRKPVAAALRGRRVVAASLTPYPTSTACRCCDGGGSPGCCSGSAEISAGSGGRGASGDGRGPGARPPVLAGAVLAGAVLAGAVLAGAVLAGPGPAVPASSVTSIAMIGVPTSTVWPSWTSRPVTTPSYG